MWYQDQVDTISLCKAANIQKFEALYWEAFLRHEVVR